MWKGPCRDKFSPAHPSQDSLVGVLLAGGVDVITVRVDDGHIARAALLLKGMKYLHESKVAHTKTLRASTCSGVCVRERARASERERGREN